LAACSYLALLDQIGQRRCGHDDHIDFLAAIEAHGIALCVVPIDGPKFRHKFVVREAFVFGD